MIFVTFDMDEGKRSASLKVKGHAGAGPKGFDTICASVSTVVTGLAQEIKNMKAKGGMFKYEPRVKVNKGDFSAYCRCTDEGYWEILRVFLVIQTQLQVVAFNYPDFVMIERLLGDKEVPHGYDING